MADITSLKELTDIRSRYSISRPLIFWFVIIPAIVALAKAIHLREAMGISLPFAVTMTLTCGILYTACFINTYFKIPRPKKGRVGIFLVFHYDTPQHLQRIDLDFIGALNSIIHAENLSSSLDVVLVPKHHYKKFLNEEWVVKRTRIYRGVLYACITVSDLNASAGLKNYCIKIKKIIATHADFGDNKGLEREFKIVMSGNGEYTFPESASQGFEVTATILHAIALYMIGRAAFLSNQEQPALQIHEKLTPEKLNHPRLSGLRRIISDILNDEYCYYSEKLIHFCRFDYGRQFAQKVDASSKYYPRALISLGIINFQEGYIEEAISCMRKARKLSNGGAIRQVATYNLGFLYLWKGDFDMGAKWLPKIRKTKSRVDSLIVDQIFDFCDMWKLAEQNNAINFWLAFLSFHKRNDVPSSQTHLLKFIELATDTEKNALHQEILQISRL